MERKLEFNFSHVFNGIVWNTVVSEDNQVLVFEIRDSERKQVSFSALSLSDNSWLWQNRISEEPWWINLNSVSSNRVLLTLYLEANNPERKGILVYDLPNFALNWWNNDFSLLSVANGYVVGTSAKYGLREVMLDIASGKEVNVMDQPTRNSLQVLRPQPYHEGSEYFNTVKIFLQKKLNLQPVSALEYMEHNGLIFISYYTQGEDLANDLIVFSTEGKVLLHEKLSDQLKGIGWDTFFILSGCVFFVRNKVELVSYKIV